MLGFISHCRSQQLLKFLNSQAGIRHNTAQGKCLDRIMPRNGDLNRSIAHDDVLSLANDLKPGLFKGPNRILMIDTWDLWQNYTATSTSRTSAP